MDENRLKYKLEGRINAGRPKTTSQKMEPAGDETGQRA
jgi:hypothetical protein